MPNLGGWEILLILIIVLVIFGPKRLPEMGRSLGKAIKEFKNAGKEIQKDIVESIDEADRDSTTTPANKRDSSTSANKTV
jgi:sec-independent protein translocase protein TatA